MQAIDRTWQPVTQTSPPWDGTPILVWQEQQGIWISARYRDQDGYGHNWHLGPRLYLPEYWMPLPEPPYREAAWGRRGDEDEQRN